MKQESRHLCTFNWKKDKILLQYSAEYENWEISHDGADEVINHAYKRLLYMCNWCICDMYVYN